MCVRLSVHMRDAVAGKDLALPIEQHMIGIRGAVPLLREVNEGMVAVYLAEGGVALEELSSVPWRDRFLDTKSGSRADDDRFRCRSFSTSYGVGGGAAAPIDS